MNNSVCIFNAVWEHSDKMSLRFWNDNEKTHCGISSAKHYKNLNFSFTLGAVMLNFPEWSNVNKSSSVILVLKLCIPHTETLTKWLIWEQLLHGFGFKGHKYKVGWRIPRTMQRQTLCMCQHTAPLQSCNTLPWVHNHCEPAQLSLACS